MNVEEEEEEEEEKKEEEEERIPLPKCDISDSDKIPYQHTLLTYFNNTYH